MLDHGQFGRNVRVGNGAGLVVARQKRAGASGRVAGVIACHGIFGYRISPGFDGHRRARRIRARKRCRRGTGGPAHADREVAGPLGSAAAVHYFLDYGQRGRDVGIGDGAGLVVAKRQCAGAIGRVGCAIACHGIFGYRESPGIHGYRRARRIRARKRCRRGTGGPAHADRKVAGCLGSAVRVQHFLDDRQFWRNVVIGNGTSFGYVSKWRHSRRDRFLSHCRVRQDRR